MTRVPPSTSAFSTLYAEQGDVGRARELYDSMRRPAAGGTRVPPPTSAFCTRVRGRDEGQGDVDRARQCYEEARGKGQGGSERQLQSRRSGHVFLLIGEGWKLFKTSDKRRLESCCAVLGQRSTRASPDSSIHRTSQRLFLSSAL